MYKFIMLFLFVTFTSFGFDLELENPQYVPDRPMAWAKRRAHYRNLVNSQALFAQDVAKLLQKANASGFTVTIGEAWRPWHTQEYYVNKGLSRTMQSKHLDRLAVDLIFYDKDYRPIKDKASLQKLGDYWESLRPTNVWGGNWAKLVDLGHFQGSVKKGK